MNKLVFHFEFAGTAEPLAGDLALEIRLAMCDCMIAMTLACLRERAISIGLGMPGRPKELS